MPHFHLCSLALHVRKCYPRGDGISNHKNLLASPILRVCVWIVSVLSVVGNMRVIVSRIRSMRKIDRGRGHSLLIVHLAVADMLMGIYLFILAAQDALLRGHYLSMQKRWRNSTTCKVCGLLTTSSYLASAFFIGLISMERLVSVERPLQTLSRNFTTLQAFTVIIWTVVGVLVVLPLIPQLADYFSTSYYTNNGACLPLYIHEPRAVGWKYSAGTFLATTLLCSMLVSIVYLKMYTAIRRSSASISSSGHGREVRLARRFAFIVLTNLACWLPVIGLKVTALNRASINSRAYAWIAIFVLPVNSALNPLLYTLTSSAFRFKCSRPNVMTGLTEVSSSDKIKYTVIAILLVI